MSDNVIPVGPGCRIIVYSDGSIDFRGHDIHVALVHATRCLSNAEMSEEKLRLLRHWIEAATQRIVAEELETRVQKSAEPRLKNAERLFRKREYLLEPVKEIILEQERERLNGAKKCR